MRVNPINEQTFKGRLSVSGLSEKQKKVFEIVSPILEKQVKPIKHLNFSISGTCSKNMVAHYMHREPIYLYMSTQVADATVPIAGATVEGTDPKTILKTAKELISKHINSEVYKNYEPPKPSFCERIAEYFKRAFMF